MVIDTDKILSDITGHLNTGLSYYEHVHLGHVGLALATAGGVLALYALYKDWKKKKGYRMAVRERTTKEAELLGQIINDGLFEAECAGKISNQRVRALYAEMSKKLDLPDLVPKQHRLPILKEELKRKRIKEGKLDIAQWKRTTFSDTVGKFKFW
jgi:hypothetical protein